MVLKAVWNEPAISKLKLSCIGSVGYHCCGREQFSLPVLSMPLRTQRHQQKQQEQCRLKTVSYESLHTQIKIYFLKHDLCLFCLYTHVNQKIYFI